ncbi:hypothetical protein VSK70_04460 [Bacillus sp. WOD8 KX774193]|uniref:Uncharacterized protein n=1 Tax=Bacillus thuringiensis subsp. konkukian (strain 97-27) TaxID=281309 RepID=Q6HH78_BACHK|nr:MULTISPECIES: hypothetical protein [Bacillus]AAT60140.1 conserved hypothetical protein [[Bacillus thuringiensis] serovar konkukian str. 97-27]AJI34293.1 hypothetical protein BG06_4969 [Bacillus thuringiensis]MEC3855221.1 hypothetical protein [Bacillus sp. WOD8 KX774193]QKI25421.1 hypothetical protein FOC86_11045 [Bacillus thuringiensis]
MKIYYCDEWSDIRKKPWNMIDECKAYLCHQNNEPYTAVLTEGERIKYVINVTKDWISVGFYDELVRKYLNYDFEVINDNRIFLRTAMYWEYNDTNEKEKTSMIFNFQENGYTVMEKVDVNRGLVEERENHDDLENKWDVFPDFGHYIHLCREER